MDQVLCIGGDSIYIYAETCVYVFVLRECIYVSANAFIKHVYMLNILSVLLYHRCVEYTHTINSRARKLLCKVVFYANYQY